MRRPETFIAGQKDAPVSFMRRLREDQRGNTIAIIAAAMIPMVGVIGCGVDISRAYLVKTRLQQACDAGVLGGRKVMTAAGLDTKTKDEVQKFVDYNFPQQTMQTTSFGVTPTLGAGNAIDLKLDTVMPTSLMKVLGVDNVPISASCTARQDFVNTDVVLVLDTTGSMNCVPSDGPFVNCPTEKAGSKIGALRQAVGAFYTALKPAQTTLEGQGLRLRYGIVPYSSTVNVGALLMASNPAWVNRWSDYRGCKTFSGATCTVINPTTTLVDHGSYPGTFWASWPGCIEERQTVTSIDASSGYTPPASAYDLDVSTIPSGGSANTENPTAWNAQDLVATSAKSTISGANACPSPAQQLQTVADVSTMDTYTSKLVATGGTYHDIGMTWGARMLSQTGLWAANNPTTYNGFPVNRDLIFMTDGALAPNPVIYSAWGIEQYEKRVTGTGNSSTDYDSHQQRFRMMCNAVKGMNVNIWVIAFGSSAGTGLSTEMINCASNSAQAFKADDQATLIAQFTQIGQTIGALRLSQ